MSNTHLSERLSDFTARAGIIISENLPADEEKTLINRVRRDCMLQYAFYSAERSYLDYFIRRELEKRDRKLKRRESQAERSASKTA